MFKQNHLSLILSLPHSLSLFPFSFPVPSTFFPFHPPLCVCVLLSMCVCVCVCVCVVIHVCVCRLECFEYMITLIMFGHCFSQWSPLSLFLSVSLSLSLT